MAVEKLSADQLEEHLAKLPGWSAEADVLRKTFQFPDFVKAMEFVNQLAETAESVQHHPDIDIRYNKVTVSLTTHDAGGLTLLDVELAATADDFAGAL